MNNIFEILSGSIPGGFALLLAVLIFINLTLYFLRKSGLLQNKVLIKHIIYSLVVIFFYTLLWLYTKPIDPPKRLIVLPTLQNDKEFKLDENSLFLAEFFETNNGKIKDRLLIHKWTWLYETLGDEKASSYEYWLNLAKNLKPFILIESKFKNNIFEITIISNEENVEIKKIEFAKGDLTKNIFNILTNFDINIDEEYILNKVPPQNHLKAKIYIAQNQLEKTNDLLVADSSRTGQILKAQSLVKKGLEFKYDQEKLEFVNIINPDFEKAKVLLYPFIRAKNDSIGVALLLGRMAIREQQFENAEIFLKKAFIDEPMNARIYFLLSHLLPSRLEELGFDNRKEILKKSVELDPGYTDAVFELANTYYITGTGAEQGAGTVFALKTLEDYLLLNKDNPKVLSMLATLYIKTEKYDQAEDIYKTLAKKYANDSNAIYNLGVVYFTKAEYDKSLSYFKKAIAMDGNLDAYLYAGIAYEMLGNKEQALKYYQDRVRYKVKDDDPYAKEAMQGIRKLISELGLTEDN